MTFYPNRLSDNHSKMLFDESGIAPEIIAERGYYTARRRSEVPGAFADYQRRLGLVVPMFSPDGESTGYQLRPDKPRRSGPKYETPAGSEVLVDVHPRILEEVRSGTGDLWITEGVKKADALTGRGLPTLALAGVWMWCVPNVKPYKLKPCFDHVRLRGRRVYVVFDSDALTKPEVQQALEALVRALEERGAKVLVVYLEDASDDSKVGADDYLAAGGTVNGLKMLARKFEPADIGRIRLSRDDRLRALVEDLRRGWWADEWKGRGGHSDRDIAHALIEQAARSGKAHPDGVRVEMSWGVLEVRAKVSRRTLAKALTRLEERGFLYRDNDGRKAEKSGAFVLRAKVYHYGEKQGGEGKATQKLRAYDPGGLHSRSLPAVPRLRWGRPAFAPKKRGFAKGTRRIRESKPLPARERIERLGKVRGAVLDALHGAGGELTLRELCEVLNKKRPSDVRRRVLTMLEEVGVIECEGDVIRLAREWREALEAERRAKGEVEADELAEDRRKRKSRAYRERDKAPVSRPSPAGLTAIERSGEKREANIAAHEEQQAKARAADLKHRQFVKCFVHDRMRELGRIRLELLQGVLKDAGGTPAYALPAAKSLGCRVERLPEFGNREFVFAPREWAEEGAA
jgi:Domain of unknown function (DUF3854)